MLILEPSLWCFRVAFHAKPFAPTSRDFEVESCLAAFEESLAGLAVA